MSAKKASTKKTKAGEVQEDGINRELLEALEIIAREKEISKETLFDTIENALLTACEKHFEKSDSASSKVKVDNMVVTVNRETGQFLVCAQKKVVEEVEDDVFEITLEDATEIVQGVAIGDTVNVEIKSKELGRIATQSAKNVVLQKIREEERSVLFKQYFDKENDIVVGEVQRKNGRNIVVNLGKVDATLLESEQVRGEEFLPNERIKVFVYEVKDTTRGPRILVSRTHPDLVRRLFEAEVVEIQDGTVEIKSIAREAGSRTKIAVITDNPNVDAVGACVGMKGERINFIVEELRGEKIDVVSWDENPADLIRNALAPSKIVDVFADPEEKVAKVVVPDGQLSLAIGKEGQNARLAARLTGYKIDIKSETQAKDAEGFRREDYYDEDDEFDGDYDDLDEIITEE